MISWRTCGRLVLPAIVLNSQQAASARAAALLASCDSDTFVFLAPEQLANAETRDTLRRAGQGCSPWMKRT